MADQGAEEAFGAIPFVAAPRHEKPFSDLRGRASVDDPSRMLEGWTSILEAQVAEWNTVSAGLLDVLARRRRAVAKIIIPPGDRVDYAGARRPNGWHGTGFLVAKNLLLTNHHVLNTLEIAASAEAEFDFETAPDDLLATRLDGTPSPVRFQLSPGRLFVTSPVTGGLDYTFIWIDDSAPERFGLVPLERASFTAKERDPTFIIHHPKGRLKEVSLDDTELLRMEGTVLHYAADTDFGSSGAPVFDRFGRLIALHHARTEQSEYRLTDGRKVPVANEGIKIASIAIDLENRIKGAGHDAGHARTVLNSIKGSDTLAGFFGGLGRTPRGASDVERVVDIYSGAGQDVDIGFWNIEWFSKRWSDPGKVEAVATVIADLNLDIWGLSEISSRAIEALVAELKERYGEHYAFELSEPDTDEHKQSTAVIWRTQTVSGNKEAWPPEIERLWEIDSRDGHGLVFNNYPALYRFEVLGRTLPFDFYLVPLPLRAMDEGGSRRRLASKLLAGAVQAMIDEHSCDRDWILGGQFNAPLASGDFEQLRDAHFTPTAAEDERTGAITYLKSPNSLIDNVFLSKDIARLSGSQDFFIVAKDRSVDKFVQRVSDHRPIVTRLSLSDSARPVRERDVGTVADAFIRRLREGDEPKQTAKSGHKRRPAHDPARPQSSQNARYVWQNLTKNEFLSRNKARLAQEIGAINGLLNTRYGGDFTRLSEHDIWVLTFIEAGLKNGRVDPDFTHSEGERGLLPLPSNVTFWNGADAPEWNRPMPIEDNLHHFYFYLGNLMNKNVRETPRFVLYRDLFKWPSIVGDPVRQAQLLAGVVHGYFVSGNYVDREVPFEHILNGFGQGQRPDVIMHPTKYVHAGKPLMTNRAKNIEAALELLSSLRG